MTFNLVDEPWIAVRDLRGDTDLVSLRALFHRAPELRRISGDLPTQDFAVLRIALAVLYRALRVNASGRDRVDVAAELFESDRLPLDLIDTYLNEWYHRFELFDDTAPFMQVPDLSTAKGETKGLELLVAGSPGAGSLFTMQQSVPSLDAATAARWLVHCQAYDFSGIKSGAVGDDRVSKGKGYPLGIGWCGWCGGLYVEGDDLRETLLHNYVPESAPDDRDLPVWELDPLTAEARDKEGKDIGPFGPVGLFTWPIRRIRLFRDGESVTRVLISNGDAIAYWLQQKHEPMTGWRLSETQKTKHKMSVIPYMPRTHDPSRAMWRGLTTLLPGGSQSVAKDGSRESLPAHILYAAAERIADEIVPARLVRTVAVGIEYGAQQSSYGEVFTDSVTIHTSITDDNDARICVLEALERADGGVSALARLAGELAEAAGGERGIASNRARERGYTALDHEFRQWLPQVRAGIDVNALLRNWMTTARRILLDEGESLLANTAPSSRGVRPDNPRLSAGHAANWFRINIDKHLGDGRETENMKGGD